MPNATLRGRMLSARLARGSIAAFAIHVAGAGLTYCSQLLIARIAGPDGYGIYSYVFAWMTVLAYFSALGFDVSLLRFVPLYQAQRAAGLLRGVMRYAERRAMSLGLAIALIGISVVAIRAGALSVTLTTTFLIGFFLVPIWALLWIRCSIARAFGGVVSALAPDRLVRDGVVVGLLGLATFGLSWRIDAPRVMGATLIGSVAGLTLVTLATRRLQAGAVADLAPRYDTRTWLQAALPLVIIGATEALMNRTGVMLLGWVGHTKDAGIYALAFNIAFVVVLPRTAVNALFAPTVSDLFVRKDHAGLQRLVTKSASWTLISGACLALPLSLLAAPLLGWLGRDFDAGIPTLRILIIAQLFAAGSGSQLYLMTMTGHERAAAALLLASAMGNAVVGAVLIGMLGLIGAAIATAATLILWNVAMALFAWRYLHLLPSVLAVFGLPVGTVALSGGVREPVRERR